MNNTQKELNLQDFKQSISFLFEMQSKCFNPIVSSRQYFTIKICFQIIDNESFHLTL